MLSKKILGMLTEQVAHELHNHSVYMAMQAYLSSKSLNGMAKFMKSQAEGEHEHADKIIDYICNHKDILELGSVTAAKGSFKTALEVFEDALKLEKGTTAKLKAIYEVAAKENDWATQNFLDWFITEQIEEEKTVGDLVAKLEGVAGAYAGVLIIDQGLK
jgi:ferritin